MAAVAPTLAWGTVWATAEETAGTYPGIFSEQISGTPAPISLPVGATLFATAGATGSQVASFVGDLTAGQSMVSNVRSVSPAGGLFVGQAITSTPLGTTWIQAINGTTLTIGGLNPTIAPATATGVAFQVADTAPYGLLAVTVTPTTGVTIYDGNFDQNPAAWAPAHPIVDLVHGIPGGSGIGNGQAMCNYSGQAEAGFSVVFADAGSFSVSVAYSTEDPSYSNATIGTPLTVTVS